MTGVRRGGKELGGIVGLVIGGCWGAVLGVGAVLADDAPAAPKLSGYVQVREIFQEDVGMSGKLNQARLMADGALPRGFTYRVLVELASGGSARATSALALRDAYIRWTKEQVAITAGQFKTPFSREYLTSDPLVETADRAFGVEVLATKRDVGVMAELTEGKATLSAGVFNGEGQNLPANRDSTVLAVARAAFKGLGPLAIGVDAGFYGSDSTRYSADVAFERGPVLVKAEYLGQATDERDDDDRAWTVLAAYRVSPLVQLLARQEDLERPGLAASWRTRATTGAVNLDIVKEKVRLLLEVISRQAGAGAERKTIGLAQLQVRF